VTEGPNNTFTIVTSGPHTEVCTFVAPSVAIRDEWVAALHAVIESHLKRKQTIDSLLGDSHEVPLPPEEDDETEVIMR